MKSDPPIRNRAAGTTLAAFLQCTNLGGMEQVAYSLFERLQARGFKLKVLTARKWGPGKPRVLQIDPAARDFDYNSKFGWRTFPEFRRHARSICQDSEKLWVIGNCASCLAAAQSTGKQVLLSHHYYHLGGGASRLKWTAFYLAFGSRLAGITYPTEFTRQEAMRIAPWLKRKMHVVRNGFDVHYTTEAQRLEAKRAARESLGIPPEAFVVGNAGWLTVHKRFDVFLHTARQISRQIPDAAFYICGGGPEADRLRQLCAELGIADQVHFTGWVQDLRPYYQAWDVVLFNSDFESLGCTPLEAASHGCLCVASCLYGGLSEFIESGKTGFLLNQHEPAALAGHIIQLHRDPELARQLRLQAVARLAREFSHEQALNFYESFFQSRPTS